VNATRHHREVLFEAARRVCAPAHLHDRCLQGEQNRKPETSPAKPEENAGVRDRAYHKEVISTREC
jgi:hypothetical protein